MPARCACGHVLGANPYHFHSCTFHRRRAVTTRHDMLVTVDFCEALGRDAGALVLAEDHSRDHDWPDLEFWTRGMADSGHIISDVSSSHAVRPGVSTPRQFVRMIREGLSICLQRGNAMVDHMGLRWASHASSRLASLIQLPSDSRRTRRGLSSQTGSRHLRRHYVQSDIRRRQFRC